MQNARNKLMDAVHSQRTRLCKTQNVIMRRPNCAGDVRAIPSLSSKMTAPCGLDRCTFSALTLCACDRNRGDRIATAAQPTFRRCNSNYIFQQRLGVFRATVASTVSLNAYTYLGFLYAWSAFELPPTTCSAARDRKSYQKAWKGSGARHRGSPRDLGAAPRTCFGNCQYGSPSS